MTTELERMVEGVWSAKTTERFIERIDDGHYEVVKHISGIDPTFSGNLFKRLRDAVSQDDALEVKRVLDAMSTFVESLTVVRRIMLDLCAVISAFPEVYGGGKEDGKTKSPI